MGAPNAGAALDPAAASDLLLLARDASDSDAPHIDAHACDDPHGESSTPAADGCAGLVFTPARPALAMYVAGIPPAGIRTRTETQVRLVLRVEPAAAVAGAAAVVVLPAGLMAHAAAATNPAAADVPAGALALTASVVRASDGAQGDALSACDACVLRERKRASRKRPDAAAVSADISADDRERILLFAGTSRVVRLIRGEAMLPVRLTCYSRHHDERAGFRVRLDLWLRDSRTHLAAALSPPIMVTDDHKRLASAEVRRQPIPPAYEPASSLSSRSVSPVASVVPRRPAVLKVVPAEGPLHGGIEVCVLGEAFVPGCAVLFGAAPAPAVSFVNASTLLVRVPPAVSAGPVAVSVLGEAAPAARPVVFFRYKNDLDHAMMEVALQLIGMRLTGRVDDARDVALRIISEFAPGCPVAGKAQAGGSASRGDWDVPRCLAEIREAILASVYDAAELETAYITVLSIARVGGEEIAAARNTSGQTVAHLAAVAGWTRLLAFIASEGGDAALHDMDAAGVSPHDILALRASRRGCAAAPPSPLLSAASLISRPDTERFSAITLGVHAAGTLALWAAVALVAAVATWLVHVRLPAIINHL